MDAPTTIETILMLVNGGSFLALIRIAFSAGKLAETVDGLDRRVAILEKAWFADRADHLRR